MAIFLFWSLLLFPVLSYQHNIRIAHGYLAKIESFPYQAQIFSWNNQLGGGLMVSFCSGSIISESVILTAAHCVYRKINAIVYVGSGIKRRGDKLKAKRLVWHPYFEARTRFDVGLIFLRKNILFSSRKQPIKLAGKDDPLIEKAVVTVAGFGRTERSPRYSFSNELLWKKILTLPRRLCKDVIDESMFCTSSGPCKGDSGSAVVKDGIQIGIVSCGYKCTQRLTLVHLTKISAVRPWIDSMIGSR